MESVNHRYSKKRITGSGRIPFFVFSKALVEQNISRSFINCEHLMDTRSYRKANGILITVFIRLSAQPRISAHLVGRKS